MSDAKERAPILWLGDATPDGDMWELTRWPGVVILGGPTILYLKVDPPIAVPAGWWICDDNGQPFAASHPVRAARAESEGTRLDGTFYKRCPLCHAKCNPAPEPASRDGQETVIPACPKCASPACHYEAHGYCKTHGYGPAATNKETP